VVVAVSYPLPAVEAVSHPLPEEVVVAVHLRQQAFLNHEPRF
jgi:hypothetical protein